MIQPDFARAAKSDADPVRIGIVTSGFHIPRTRLLAAQIEAFAEEEVQYIPAYGPTTHRDTWFENPVGLGTVLEELRKTVILEKR